MRRFGALITVLLSLTLIGCSAPNDVPITYSSKSPLAPFEEPGWPSYLTALDLPAQRDYVILAYVPPANAIDLTTPERARGTLAKMVFDQLGAMKAGTTIGHLIVGWQCGDTRGMTSMTGEQSGQGKKMLLNGWGVTPVFSTFLDGEIVPLNAFPPAQARTLSTGRGVVIATQVSRSRCLAAREEVREFATHENEPHENYSLLLRPGHFEGGGCLSFAMEVAEDAGVMPRLAALTRRDIDLRKVQLGARDNAPEQVTVYRAPNGKHPQEKRGLISLLTTRWNQGKVIDTVTIPDGEAIMAAMVYAHIGEIPKNDWTYRRIMSRDDPVIAQAATYGLHWARSYPNRRIADPDGVRALVLEY
ncbi:MAG: hypothetical protein ACRBCL_10375 [Maritimibacter sp.]